jgi:hypothetical protein
MNLKNIYIIVFPLIITGCATMFTGNRQDVDVRTHNDTVGTKLDNVAQFNLVTDKNRVIFRDVKPGTKVNIRRTGTPVTVQIIESECILPTEEKFDSGVHGAVFLDVLATSPLSTSIDSSTGAAWSYDDTLHVTPKIKDTPECHEWLENEVSKMNANVSGSFGTNIKYDTLNAIPVDPNAVKHKPGYEKQFANDKEISNNDQQSVTKQQ